MTPMSVWLNPVCRRKDVFMLSIIVSPRRYRTINARIAIPRESPSLLKKSMKGSRTAWPREAGGKWRRTGSGAHVETPNVTNISVDSNRYTIGDENSSDHTRAAAAVEIRALG